MKKCSPHCLIPFLIFIGLSSIKAATAETSVWKVSDGTTHLYLAGTVHMLSQADYPLPEEFNEAYADTSELVFETELDKMHSSEFTQQAMSAFRYEDGATLPDKLSPETAERLTVYLKSKNIPIETVAPFKPGWLMSLVTIIELESLGIKTSGVDQHFFNQGIGDGKSVQHLESIDLQLSYIANLGVENPERFVNYMLNELTKMREVFDGLRNAWRTGDMDKMETLGIEKMKTDYPLMYTQLIKNRNDLWVPKIISMFDNTTTEMILVGALHLAGKDGLLEQLKVAGFSIKKL